MLANPAAADPLWQWIVTTVVILLAGGGGIVALKKGFSKPPAKKLETYLLMEENGRYTLAGTPNTYTICPRSPAPASAGTTSSTGPDFPRLILNITNVGQQSVPVHTVRVRFESLRELPPAHVTADRVIVRYRSGMSAVAREQLEVRHNLVANETDGEMILYRVSAGRPLNEVAAALNKEPLVEFAGVDAEGSAHREFEKIAPVDLRLEPDRLAYDYAISHTVAPHQTIQVPVILGATRSLMGLGELTLAFAGGLTHAVGTLNVQLDVPPGTQAVEQ